MGRPLDAVVTFPAGLLERVRTGGQVAATDVVCHRSTGEALDVSVSATQVVLHGRAAVGLCARDIGERKRAEAQAVQFHDDLERIVRQRTDELRSAQHDLRNVVDALPSMVGYWDKDQRNRFSNSAYSTWFGIEPTTLIGRSLADLLGPATYEKNRPHIEAVLRGERQVFERSIPRPDGKGDRHSLAHYIPDVVDGAVRGFYVLVHDVTELTESRRALAATVTENEVLTSTLRSYTMVSVADASGHITDVNDLFCARSGYARAELIGQDHRILSSGKHSKSYWDSVWATLRAGRAWRGEICDRAKDGSLFWVDAVIAPFRAPDGSIEKFVSIRNDLTETKALTQQLASERERLSRIFRATEIGTWEFNVTTGESRFDEQSAQLLGYSSLTRELYASRLRPDDLVEARRALAEHVEGRTPDFLSEVQATHRDGSTRWLLCKGRVATRTSEGKAEWVYGTFQDVTENKAARERIEVSEAILDRAGQIAKVGGWQHDLETGAVVWTSQTRRLLEVTPDFQASASALLLFVAPEARARMYEALDSASHGGVGWDMELPLVTSSGRRIWVRSQGRADMFGKRARRVTGAFQDITHKRAKDEDLRRATEAAKAANAAKSEFLANMSHEIRTPLNAIIGLSYLLGQTKLDTDQHGQLDKIQSAGSGLLSVINSVLDLSKIEAGEMVLEKTPFSLDAVLDEVKAMLATQAAQKGVALIVDRDPTIPAQLEGDPTRLRQVVLNFASNALKFTERGEVTIRVNCLEHHKQTVKLAIAVRDTGVGISKTNLDKLFEPFSQGDASTTRKFGGTGLGLSIVRRLVELMGGEVGVSSTLGTGSEFWAHVPFRATETQALLSQTTPAPVGERKPLSRDCLSGFHVLVVDDSSINVEVAERVLSLFGASATSRDNGRDAVELVLSGTETFDLVLMDTQMPVLDGNDATRQIRNAAGFENLPIVALTAGALATERSRAMEAGAVAFLSKPVNPDELVRTVLKFGRRLRRSSPQNRAGAAAPALEWPAVEGIDHSEIRVILNGDADAFTGMLERLLAEFADLAGPEARTLLLDSEVLARRAHKLKGSAGVIGAKRVAEQAEALEALLLRGPGHGVEAAVDALGEALAALELAAKPALAARQRSRDSGVRAAPLDAAATDRVVDLLKRQDLSVLECIGELAEGLRATLGESRFQSFRSSVEGLRFGEALSLIQAN